MANDKKGPTPNAATTKTDSLFPTGCISCGILTGAVSSTLFTPFDRALYLSVTARRPIFDRRNWLRPYQGVLNTFTSRAINTGLYYPLESIFTNALSSLYTSPGGLKDTESQRQGQVDAEGVGQTKISQKDAEGVLSYPTADEPNSGEAPATPKWIFLAAGQLVGLTSAVVCHPINMLKCASWSGHSDTSSGAFFQFVRRGGVRQLYRGMGPTMMREAMFGGIFSLLRHGYGFSSSGTPPVDTNRPSTCDSTSSDPPTPAQQPSDMQSVAILEVCNPFVENFVAAAIGVVFSSPFNYARNMQLSTPIGAPTPTTWSTLGDLWREAFHSASAYGNAPCDRRSNSGVTAKRGAFPQLPKSRTDTSVSPSTKNVADAIPQDIQRKVPRCLVRHPTVRGVVIIADRLRIGWGSVRASIGMSIGAVVYGACLNHLVPLTGGFCMP
ncbi:mitochondrial carrier superfamily protein [Toxoplasma gondii GAB2-2007-GAL-DOM2]|uniref:Mitochondrial carrier superfamily protein n=4 Tax=Toxoplasma gondii TaxID=5811 RepID=S7UFW9_TOXGG|nr:mitochondrial carrier superfamily protein [Toxoplasma gondii GT1]KAF4643126.1 mitochondrial carrier superfamily protein [Toxoplasma gondii]KFG36564.1 mitochondrial carrier superfamily protein [Toxoplasma gondii GAB2-2007-GAL-DOM2]KFG51590.1 mitochondrial carrier superfamily protein [Toxoplasma gondii FOU]